MDPKSEVFLEILAMLWKTYKGGMETDLPISDDIIKTMVFRAFVEYFKEKEEI